VPAQTKIGRMPCNNRQCLSVETRFARTTAFKDRQTDTQTDGQGFLFRSGELSKTVIDGGGRMTSLASCMRCDKIDHEWQGF
jgi:hypothetical protein